MKHCLLAAATVIEIAPLLEKLRKEDHWPPSVTIDVLVTGIGLTAASYALTRQLALKRPDFVIQAGVGGCFDHQTPLGGVVAVKQEAIADQSVIELNELKTLFDLKLVPQNRYPFSKGWLINKNDILNKTRLKKVKGISVNEITTSGKKAAFYRQHFNPVVESMEGAALHYVCLMEKVPFIQLRSISNYIGERNKRKWEMKKAVANLNHELFTLLNNL